MKLDINVGLAASSHRRLFQLLCRYCGKPGTLRLMVGGCDQSPLIPTSQQLSTVELWVSALASTGLDNQHRLAQRAVDAARAASWTEDASFKLQYNPPC